MGLRDNLLISCFFHHRTVRKAIRVALVVGPILGMINHFDLLLGAEVTLLRLSKITVTFLVPFCVSAYSSATTMMADALEHDALESACGSPAMGVTALVGQSRRSEVAKEIEQG